METFACELVPTLRLDDLPDKTSQSNIKSKEWSANNETRIIKTQLKVKLVTSGSR